nr:hypothetical protein CFP56_36027 [Quercus suber]
MSSLPVEIHVVANLLVKIGMGYAVVAWGLWLPLYGMVDCNGGVEERERDGDFINRRRERIAMVKREIVRRTE